MDRRNTKSTSRRNMGRGELGGGLRPADFPLRILVLSEMVGAIIGRQGATIKAITQESRARVDVHRKDNVGSMEKAITIYGNPENCTNACKRILEVMQEESNNTNKGEIPLKILAHNNLIGRIIGKGGATIKKLMEETNSKITVSSINDINSYNLERIITIKGEICDIAKAENMISAKLRHSYESDLKTYAPQTTMFPGLHPMTMMSTSGYNCPRRGPTDMYRNSNSPIYPSSYQNHTWQQSPNDTGVYQECAYLYIPNSAVGALIGTKGNHIRNVIKFSGATIKISPLDRKDEVPERKVTIIGTPESQWKAQFLIYEKLREEGFAVGMEELRLTVEIQVPTEQVGRIIGKGGQNVRDLQRQTGALIKLPQQGSSPEETLVHIGGTFFSVQSAQRRIRAIIQASQAMMNNRPSTPMPLM